MFGNFTGVVNNPGSNTFLWDEAAIGRRLKHDDAAGACPDAKALAARIDEVAQRLRTTLPAAQPAAK